MHISASDAALQQEGHLRLFGVDDLLIDIYTPSAIITDEIVTFICQTRLDTLLSQYIVLIRDTPMMPPFPRQFAIGY